jgi:hypothetical protein
MSGNTKDIEQVKEVVQSRATQARLENLKKAHEAIARKQVNQALSTPKVQTTQGSEISLQTLPDTPVATPREGFDFKSNNNYEISETSEHEVVSRREKLEQGPSITTRVGTFVFLLGLYGVLQGGIVYIAKHYGNNSNNDVVVYNPQDPANRKGLRDDEYLPGQSIFR